MEKKRLVRQASSEHPQYVVSKDGIYLFILKTKATFANPTTTGMNHSLKAQVVIEMKSEYGYLSVVDWPLLPVLFLNLILQINYLSLFDLVPKIVLCYHVRCLYFSWFAVAHHLPLSMERYSAHSDLDRWRPVSRNARNGIDKLLP